MNLCPCGSQKSYADCCEPIHLQKIPAPTAEALMRSRYSAYAKGVIDWIAASQNSEQTDMEATRQWSQGNTWLGLQIVRTELGGPQDDTGLVEFIAKYSGGTYIETHHEVGSFVKVDGKWLFDKGEVIPSTVVRKDPKVGRNEPCPCGSGKKYKACHGK